MKSILNRRTECNICYKNVVRLTQHVRQAHDMDMSTYIKILHSIQMKIMILLMKLIAIILQNRMT